MLGIIKKYHLKKKLKDTSEKEKKLKCLIVTLKMKILIKYIIRRILQSCKIII